MKKYKGIIIKRLLLSIITNPIFLVIYWISFYELYTLCRFGRFDNNITILFACMIFFLVCFIYLVIRIMRKNINIPQHIINQYEVYGSSIRILENQEIQVGFEDIKSFSINKKYCFIELKNKEILILNMIDKDLEDIKIIRKDINDSVRLWNKSFYKLIWTYIAIIIMVATTVFYGQKIYKTAIKFNGKLSWVLNTLENERTIKFEHNNIYEYGVEGIFTDISKKLNMPETLYISSDGLSINFNSDGTITDFDGFLYGKNEKDELESYLITYNKNKSKKIIVHLNGYVNADFNEDKVIEPLINTMKVIPLKDTVSKWNEKEYGILYQGKRSWGFNTDGIVYIDLEGNTKLPNVPSGEIIGYTVSVYVPGKEKVYTPVRYNLTEDLNNIKKDHLNIDKNKDKDKLPSNVAEEFYLSDKVGYRLIIAGAALGSRFYALDGTLDGGETWETINENPFSGQSGGASGITFINEKIGFLALSHSGGIYADLYRTEDGGLSYEKISLPELKIPLGEETYNPFDFPEMPYEEGEILNILVEQGADGDYNGGSKALYQSKDEGKTWEYIKEVTRE